MDSEEEPFWCEFKHEFGALLEIWGAKELREEEYRIYEKHARFDLWTYKTYGYIPSEWILGHEFGEILLHWEYKSLCEYREKRWQKNNCIK